MTKSRRVVHLSRVDRERLERGEITAPEEALHKDDPPARVKPVRAESQRREGLSARDREIAENRPPHWG
ncbi:hypothetical protein [Flaviflexus equikiangi]|uniref:Uncharacterized protein n=1 Tax=Flaviflexus equikiangi TaxID=2758573 RepID=A0ABS2TGS7_9ACTO|nr:hypothetical protein [Flaviflexus equikiangi]MBM9432479.1 hypothetical protein [Flaviflexus equikiangi]